jgi:hypothetical protein
MHNITPDIPVKLLTIFELLIPKINPNNPTTPPKISSKKINAKIGMLNKINDKFNRMLTNPNIKENNAFLLFIFITLISFN